MSDLFFIGGAASTAQVDTLTVGGTVEVGDKFLITLHDYDGTAADQTLSVDASSTSTSTTATDIATAFNASTNSLFTGITAAPSGSTVTLTADTAGVPFYCSVSTTESNDSAADSQTFSRAATTANSHSQDWSAAANWSTGSVPVATDNVYLDGRAGNAITRGLNQSSITLASFIIDEAMAYAVGTIANKLRISATKADIGRPATGGSTTQMSALINLDFGSNVCTGIIYRSNNIGTSGQPAIQIKGTHASNAFTVMGNAIVGFGTNTRGEATTVATLTVKDTAIVTVGSGVTLTTVNPEGGKVLLNCAATTIAYGKGTVETAGTGAITTVNVGGKFIGNSTGTITTLVAAGTGFADFTQSTAARTVTTGKVDGEKASISVDNGVPLSITFTNAVQLLNGAKSMQMNFGDGVSVQQS
jgi:hypothetical protein